MATINDIAKKANVAKSTVSNVLTGRKFVSEEIKKRVLDVCKELDYQPNFFASTLSAKNKTNIIGLFLEQTESEKYNKFYSNLIEAVLTNLSINKKSLLIYHGLPEDEITNKLKQGTSPIDGAIILSPMINDERIQALGKNLIPFIVIGHPVNNESINYVDTNNISLTHDITKKMAEKGHKNICLINSNEKLVITKERDEGFIEALRNNKEIKYTIFHSKDSSFIDGYNFSYQAIKNGYTAFITASSIIASGIYKACDELNLTIGKDIVIFSLGYSFGEELKFTPSLSYATQDYYQFGETASKHLLAIIEGDTNPVKEIIESQIHYHNSFK